MVEIVASLIGVSAGPIIRLLVIRWGRLGTAVDHALPHIPILEVALGIVGAFLAWRASATPALPAYVYLGIVATALAMIDTRTRQLPEILTLPSYPIGIALLALGGSWANVGQALLGMIGLLGIYGLIWLLAPGFGFADVVFAGICGLFLDYLGLHAWFLGVWAGFLLAGGHAVLLRMRRSAGTTFAFGPWMAAGTLIGVIAGT